MGHKFLAIVAATMIVMISACASSGDNWPKEVAIKKGNDSGSWQKNEKTDNADKETANSSWKDQSRY